MKNRIIAALLFCLGFALAGRAQAPPPTKTFSVISQAIALPGGKQTVAANITGGLFSITPNFSLRSDNVIATGNGFTANFGGIQYNLPVLSRKLNDMSPNLSGSDFRFYVTASAGVDRPATGGSHYAFLAGGGVDYAPAHNRVFSVNLVEVRWAKLPGYNNSTAIVASGIKLSF